MHLTAKEIKHDKDGNIGLSIGRKSFPTENLVNNFKHFVDFIKKEKPDAIKGEFIKNIFISSSMGVSIKVSSKGIALQFQSQLTLLLQK